MVLAFGVTLEATHYTKGPNLFACAQWGSSEFWSHETEVPATRISECGTFLRGVEPLTVISAKAKGKAKGRAKAAAAAADDSVTDGAPPKKKARLGKMARALSAKVAEAEDPAKVLKAAQQEEKRIKKEQAELEKQMAKEAKQAAKKAVADMTKQEKRDKAEAKKTKVAKKEAADLEAEKKAAVAKEKKAAVAKEAADLEAEKK